jgi:hypothetical protein
MIRTRGIVNSFECATFRVVSAFAAKSPDMYTILEQGRSQRAEAGALKLLQRTEP